jgi:hypothetical protein
MASSAPGSIFKPLGGTGITSRRRHWSGPAAGAAAFRVLNPASYKKVVQVGALYPGKEGVGQVFCPCCGMYSALAGCGLHQIVVISPDYAGLIDD